MKIDESSINHNAVRLIGDLVEELYEFSGPNDPEDHMRIATLGEIHGICKMATCMKEVLRLQ